MQLVENPIPEARNIYKFIGTKAPPESAIDLFIGLAERGTRNVTARANAFLWREYVTQNESSEIVRACSDMFDFYPQYGRVTPIENSTAS